MKLTKTLFASTGVLLLAAFGLISCANDVEYNATTKVSAPEVTATAYPGVNVITWKAVKNATNYLVYETVGNNGETLLGSTTNLYYTSNAYAAIESNASVSYKYRVVANASSNFASNESSKTVKTKATVAAIGTSFSALNSTDYEPSFDKNATALSADAITVSQLDTDGTVTVAFPVKSYAKYDIYVKNSDTPDALASTTADKTVEGAQYANNAVAIAKLTSVTSGTKSIVVKATPYYEGYDAEEFTASKEITVPSLAVTKGSSYTAKAVYTSSTTARISWQAATFTEDGTTVPSSYYRVYRKNADGSYTTLKGSIVTGGYSTSTYVVYYIDDTIDNNELSYGYTIAVTDGTSYGDSLTATLPAYSTTASALTTFTATPYVGDNDALSNDIRVVITLANANQTIDSLSYVLLDEKTKTYADSAFTSLTLTNNNTYSNSYIVYLADKEVGTYLFKAVVKEDGKADNVEYTTATVSEAVISSNLYITASENKNDAGTVVTSVDLTITDSDDFSNKSTESISNYSYTIKRVRTSVANTKINSGANVTVVSSDVKSITLAAIDAIDSTDLSQGYSTTYTDNVNVTLPTTTPVTTSLKDFYYVVKERVDGSGDAVKSAYSATVTYY